MIRLADYPADDDAVARIIAAAPAMGTRIWAAWRMKAENPLLPGLFYRVDEDALLVLSGRQGTLCGPVENDDELAEFLQLYDVSRLAATDYLPPGWKAADSSLVMVRPLDAPRPPGNTSALAGLEEMPPAREVAALLEHTGLLCGTAQGRENFIADYSTRRNHGASCVLGLRRAGALAATAGVYAIAPSEAYVAAVATLPAHRGQNLAGELLAALAARFSTLPLSLLCHQSLASYYISQGFSPSGHRRIDSVPFMGKSTQ